MFMYNNEFPAAAPPGNLQAVQQPSMPLAPYAREEKLGMSALSLQGLLTDA